MCGSWDPNHRRRFDSKPTPQSQPDQANRANENTLLASCIFCRLVTRGLQAGYIFKSSSLSKIIETGQLCNRGIQGPCLVGFEGLLTVYCIGFQCQHFPRWAASSLKPPRDNEKTTAPANLSRVAQKHDIICKPLRSSVDLHTLKPPNPEILLASETSRPALPNIAPDLPRLLAALGVKPPPGTFCRFMVCGCAHSRMCKHMHMLCMQCIYKYV